MRVKATDIAKELGISKATVSLALNNRPGVNENTRKEVLECKKRMEANDGARIHAGAQLNGVIKSVVAIRELNTVRGDILDLWTDVNTVMDRIAKSWGCSLEVSFFNILHDSPEALAEACNQDQVIGVVISGTEMFPGDEKNIAGIKKPLVVYDADLGEKYPCILFNNAESVMHAVRHLADRGRKNIFYLARSIDIYNYTQRRTGFCMAMKELGMGGEERILKMGTKTDEMYLNLKEYLKAHELPDAFIMESYHLSIAAVRVFKQLGIRVPGDVGIVGVDELPEYMADEYTLTTIKVPHTERGKVTMMLLRYEIENSSRIKSKVLVNCEFVEGNTVSERK